MRRVALGAMALAGLGAFAAQAAPVDECAVVPDAASKDLFPAAAGTTVNEARKFKIEYFPGYKIVTNVAAKRQYILYSCGSAEPDVTGLALPEGYKRAAFAVPAQKAVTAETVSYDFMTQLDNGINDMGVTDRIMALSPYTTNACGQKALACKPEENKLVAGLGPAVPGWGAKGEDYQKLMDQAQVYFDSSDGKTGVTGDKSVVFSATQETSLLGRGEWLKFAAAFFNLDHVAERKFDETRAIYNAVSTKAQDLEARPKTLFLDIDTYSDKLNDFFTVSLAGYKRSAVLDAGGFIPNVEDFVGMTGVSFPPNMRGARWAVPKALSAKANATDEEKAANAAARTTAIADFLKAIEDTDVIIDERYATSVLTIEQALAPYGLTPADTKYKFIANKKWFREDKTGSATGSAWFETGVSRPEVVLMDFVKVLHPEAEVGKAHATVFLRDVFAGEGKTVLTPADCKSAFPICDAAVAQYPAAPICPVREFKTCDDGFKVFLASASACSDYEPCPAKPAIAAVSTDKAAATGADVPAVDAAATLPTTTTTGGAAAAAATAAGTTTEAAAAAAPGTTTDARAPATTTDTQPAAGAGDQKAAAPVAPVADTPATEAEPTVAHSAAPASASPVPFLMLLAAAVMPFVL